MKKTMVCFGDSNTHGYDSATDSRFNEEERWTCLLQKYLCDGCLIREEGLSGRTAVFDDPLFEGLNGLKAIYPCLMTHEPVDLLIIMLGTNDTKERFSCNAQNIAKGVERLAARAIASPEAFRSSPNILLIAPAPIEDGYEETFVAGEMGKGCAEKSRQLSGFYEAAAKRLGCHFLDAGTLGLTMHPRDHMHLDLRSHRVLAEELSRLIPKII